MFSATSLAPRLVLKEEDEAMMFLQEPGLGWQLYGLVGVLEMVLLWSCIIGLSNAELIETLNASECGKLCSKLEFKQKCPWGLLNHHVLTKTFALVGGPVNKDFG